MELWKELLISGLQNGYDVLESINDSALKKIIEDKSYKVLLEIKEVLNDSNLTDEDCFYKIEKIVCVFEAIGSNGGSRHDF